MTPKSPERITIPELQTMLSGKNKPLVIDVRKPAEIAETGCIPGAVHIPVDSVPQRATDLPKDRELIFYCGGGGRASRAAQAAWEAGHRRVRYFGLRDWNRKGLPTAKSAARF